MKVRIKYTKSGNLRFIGHLDVMRFFQKAVKRAGFDIAYSKGYSPHQLMSFAAPLALGVTSEGEYFDAEFNTVVSSDEFVRRFNEQMTEGMAVSDVILLPDNAKNSMSVVAGSDYLITIQESVPKQIRDKLLNSANKLLNRDSIEILKKTKKSEKMEDIRPGIFEILVKGDRLYFLLATGSEYNLKPELVIEALCIEIDYPYEKFDYRIHRIETYMKNDEGKLVSLLESGKKIRQE